MFSLRNKKKISLKYPQYPFLNGALVVHTVELQWLEHGWLVYLGCFELVLESLGNNSHSCRFENGILCVLIRIASSRRF